MSSILLYIFQQKLMQITHNVSVVCDVFCAFCNTSFWNIPHKETIGEAVDQSIGIDAALGYLGI
jgi:hypothetical protein